MELAYPFHLDSGGRAASAPFEAHIRQMIEQVLFTAPGERVNHPDFGCGLLQFLFGPNSVEMEAGLRLIVQSSLARWLGHIIQVQSVAVSGEDSALTVTIQYSLIQGGRRFTAEFRRFQR